MKEGYAMVGRAVIAAQTFETAFVPIVEALKMLSSPEYLNSTQGLIGETAWRGRISAAVTLLRKQQRIDPDFADRIEQFLEQRNKLVHRWVREHGWPADGDAEEWGPLMGLSNFVYGEAMELSRQVTDYALRSLPFDAPRGDSLIGPAKPTFLG